jgi:hypothetical protein
MRLLRLAAPLAGALLLAAQHPLAAQKTTPPARKAPPAKAPAAKPAAAPAPPAPPTTGFLQGVAFDSVNHEPLAGAMIAVEGSTRMGMTDSIGQFLLDSILPGRNRILVDHAILDTLGIALTTAPMEFAANSVTRVELAVPGAETLTALFCPAARRTLGPGAIVGRVREPDSDVPAVGARVSFVWFDPDPPGLPSGVRPTKRAPRVRETVVAADGTYRLCGLPSTFEGKLQAQRKDGGATAEVTLSQTDGLLTLRSMSVAPLPVVASRDTAGGKAPVPPTRGSARVLGKVVNKNGAPVPNARVSLMGTSAATLTRANGDFVLDSLPAGTQALVVRQLGYRPAEQTVELSSRAPQRVTVRLGEFVPELSPVEVVSRRDEGLRSVGFLDRKRSAASGRFLDGDEIEKRNPTQFTDIIRTIPGIRVQTDPGTNQASLVSTRSAQGSGCVTVFVDGARWQQLQPGDLDSFVQPTEVAAVEVYSSSANMPAQFATIGEDCAAVVVWTKTRVLRRGK